jgi:hypothetical protein
MKSAPESTISCGPQPFADEPSHGWDLDRLGKFLQEQHLAIVEGEKQLAPVYWRMGQASNLARKHFSRGQWGRYLESLNIHKTRAARAQAIFRTFSADSELGGLSVEEAYESRTRRHRPQCDNKRRMGKGKRRAGDKPFSLRAVLQRLSQNAESLAKQPIVTDPAVIRRLLPCLDEVIGCLEELRQQLDRNMVSAAKQSHSTSGTFSRGSKGNRKRARECQAVSGESSDRRAS